MMNKKKALALALAIFTTVSFTACSGDDKKAPAPTPQKKAEAAKPANQNKAPEVKKQVVRPVPKSKLYKYALHLNDVEKIPPMTDEVIAEFEKQAKKVQIAPEDKQKGRHGIWVFNSSPQKKGEEVYLYRWTAELDGHHDNSFTNDKGKKINEQHYAHIDMRVDGKTEKLLSVRLVKYHVTKEIGERGKLEEIYKETFK